MWMAMAFFEYIRYYVINDKNMITFIEAATGSPQSLVKAFLFPFWGVAADRVSRRKVIVAASIADCASVWLLCLMPSVEILVFNRCLSLVGDVGWSVRDAMLRDMFSDSEWERQGGGITGIKARMAVFGTVMAAISVGIGMGLLWLGDAGILGLANEYTKHKEECFGRTYCVPRGQYSWNGAWEVDGSLRVLMLMGAVTLTAEAILILCLLPETLKPESRAEASLWVYFKRHWRSLGTPWNNLRVFATTQLQALTFIRVLFYIIGVGGTAQAMTWYRRHERNLDTFTMYSMGIAAGAVGFITLLLIGRIVKRYGDLRGIWVSSNIFSLLFATSVALIPAAQWQLSFVAMPIFMGPAGGLGGFCPELLSKLVPPDIQGTFQTGKSFLYDVSKATFVWPWMGLFVVSEKLAYPFDALAILVAIIIGIIALWITLGELPNDPKKALEEGRIFDEYWETPYIRSKWYRRHGGRLAPTRVMANFSNELTEPVPALTDRIAVAEGASKKALLLPWGSVDGTLPSFLQDIGRVPLTMKSLSVVFMFVDGDDLFPIRSKLEDPISFEEGIKEGSDEETPAPAALSNLPSPPEGETESASPLAPEQVGLPMRSI